MAQDKLTPHMSEEEYLRRMENLQSVIAEGIARGEPAETLNARYADLEFDLTIDYRLGRDFPQERRRQLRAAHGHFEQEKGLLANELMQGRLGEKAFRKQLQELIDAMAARYSEVLTPHEYTDFIGPDTGVIANAGEEP